MIQAQQVHPSLEQLTAFGRGEFGDAEHANIEKHLVDCDACCQTLKALPDDTIVALLRDQPSDTSVSPDRVPVTPKDAEAFPATIEQATIRPAPSPTKMGEQTDLAFTRGLPAELRDHPRYDVLELLGKGGMGDVYKAHHRMMNRPVALKLINRQLVQNDAAIKRFHREVQAAARLSHPNIVTAYDAERASDVHFLVMEFVGGMDLAEVVRQRGPLPVQQACDYIRQAAAGLQHAHELGMVHRDIKPQNLMLAEDGKVKILDFGLANFATEAASAQVDDARNVHNALGVSPHLTLMGSMMGTPDYMAPEQAHDAHSADIRADIYSLGCTLYCLLAGKAPFAEGSVMDKVMAHSQRAAVPLSEVRPDVPAELALVVQRMMAKSPDERYQTPSEVVAALDPFAKHASPYTSHAKLSSAAAQRSSTKRLAIVATLLLGLFIALATVIVVTNQGRLEIQSEVDDVQIVVKQGGEEVTTIDLKTGSKVNWLSTGKYELELVGGDNDVKLNENSFQMTRLGKVIVTAKWNSEGAGVVKSFDASDEPITQDGVAAEDGGWKITAAEERSVQLFEVKNPSLQTGPFFYRAQLKTENVKGRAYLEMWVRFPGEGEFFSKGFNHALSGSNGWAEYEIPFLLKKGQQPDLVKLNLSIEGSGTVWIKDVELRGRQSATNVPQRQNPADTTLPDETRLQGKWVPISGHMRAEPFSAEQLARMSITFDGESVALVDPNGAAQVQTGTFTINSARDPKHVDFIAPDGRERMPGIFEFADEGLKLAWIDQDYARPTDFTTSDQPDHLTATFERAPVAGLRLGQTDREVLKAAEAFLVVLDEGKFGEVHDLLSAIGKQHTTRESFSHSLQQMRDLFGRSRHRVLHRVQLIDNLSRLPEDRFAGVQYKSDHELKSSLWETLFLNVEPDGRWRVNTYGNTLDPLPFPDTKNVAPSVGPNERPTTTQPGPTRNGGTVKAGVNLIFDPSLENTPAGNLPTGWSAWLDDGPDFKGAIVEGGVTGKHCLQIAGKGTRGVVFCNSLPLDRTKRYALKGRIKCEGDATTRAVVKFNYFHAGKWLGVNDLVGVAGNQTGWQLFEKTDVADTIPDATLLVPTCHIEGNGTAWFDDLELIAYDGGKLPADFDVLHGKNNRLTAELDFDRWVGHWESTTVYKPTTSTPDETTVKGEVVIRKVLDDRFLFWQWASEAGDQQYASLFGLDPYAGGYHIWLFGSGGEVYERIGQWDTASQTLTMQAKPMSRGVGFQPADLDQKNVRQAGSLPHGISTDRFASNDRIESTLLVKSADGQVTRDLRATWVRKSAEVPEEIALANSPAAGVDELAILQKMAGNWTIRQTNKPSVWFPDVETSTATEHAAWAIGGRFMLFRSYDDKQNMKTLAFMTYEPAEKSYRIWHFANDVFGGQWRITWDASSRGFHWRSIDMPTGWIGTGFNRWIDDDTFDNQALIKDEQGRVLLDSQQEKKRIE